MKEPKKTFAQTFSTFGISQGNFMWPLIFSAGFSICRVSLQKGLPLSILKTPLIPLKLEFVSKAVTNHLTGEFPLPKSQRRSCKILSSVKLFPTLLYFATAFKCLCITSEESKTSDNVFKKAISVIVHLRYGQLLHYCFFCLHN